MIKKQGNKYVLYSHDGSRKLGTYNTRTEAIERERQVMMFKNMKKGK